MGSKTSTTTENSDPWGPSQGYMKQVMAEGRGLWNKGTPMVAPENPYLQKGYQSTLQAADKFNPSLTQAGMGQMQDTISGDYMDGNPYLDSMYGRAADKVNEGVSSMFSGAGRYGSGAHQDVMGQSLGDLASNMYGTAYQTERQNQLNAAQAAPGMDNAYQGMLFNNANAITGVGQQMQDHDQQRQLDDYNRLDYYSGIINGYGGLGGTRSQTNPGPSKAGGVLGGAASGAAAGSAFGPWGTAAGAALGGIGGLF